MRYHYLKDFSEFSVRVRPDAYYTAFIDRARNELFVHNLKFDDETGTVIENNSWIERPSNLSDYTRPADKQDIWDWYFNRHICARAARLHNRALAA